MASSRPSDILIGGVGAPRGSIRSNNLSGTKYKTKGTGRTGTNAIRKAQSAELKSKGAKGTYVHGSKQNIRVGEKTLGIRPGGTSATKNKKVAKSYAVNRFSLKSQKLSPKLYTVKPVKGGRFNSDKSKNKDLNPGEVRGDFVVTKVKELKTSGRNKGNIKPPIKKTVKKGKK